MAFDESKHPRRKDGSRSAWLTMFNAVAEERLKPQQSVLPRNFKLTNPEPGVWIVHDVPIFYETVRDGDHYDSSWMGRAVANSFQAQNEDGHLAPMHVHHRFRPDLQAFAAGAVRVTGSRSTRYKGRQTTAIFGDLIVTHENIAREIAEHRLMWRSPEVSFSEARIVSLALLDHEAPFFEGPVLTVETEDGATVPLGAKADTAFQMVADPEDCVVAFSRSGSLTRALFRDGEAMTYPIPRRFEEDDPKDAGCPKAAFCDDKNAEEGKDVEQMMDGGHDAPGGSENSGGTDAPGGTDQEKPKGFNDGVDSGEEGNTGEGEGPGDAENKPTGFEDDDEDDSSSDGPPQIDGDGDADEGLAIPSEGDADGQRDPVDANGQPAGNPLMEAMQNTPATLEQSIEALGFLQSLVQKMKGGPAAPGQDAGVQPPAQPPIPTEGPSDQMSKDSKTIQQFSELKGKVTALEANEAKRKKDASIATFADTACERLKGTTVGQDPSLRSTLIQFANEHGLSAAQTYAEGLRKHAFAVAPSGGRTMSMLADDVPDELKVFQAEGPEAYERASGLYAQFQDLQAHGMCLGINFKTFAEREAKGVTVPRHG
jgi:hypothetical protein